MLSFGDDKTYMEQIDCKTRIANKEFLVAKIFEYDVRFPFESQLTLEIHDKSLMGLIGVKTEIGRTEIDLESRYYSKCYATCGLPKSYEVNGYNAWRDSYTPSQILNKMCKDYHICSPIYQNDELCIKVPVSKLDKELQFQMFIYGGTETKLKYMRKLHESYLSKSNLVKMNEDAYIREHLALDALNDWKRITGQKLVPEHIEKRGLFTKYAQDLLQGNIEMWIDMFPNGDAPIPKIVDISLPKPTKLQLRVVIKNTSDVYLDDYDPITNQRTSDIYVKGWIGEQIDKIEKTDVHYRSKTGEGNFNYRFIFNFDYLVDENKIVTQETQFNVFKRKFGVTQEEVESKVEPEIHLQVFDADLITSDDFLGTITLNLCSFMRGASAAKQCKLEKMTKKSWERVNLFQLRKLTGWWPFSDLTGEKLMGKLEAEFTLMTEVEANKNPAGRGHEGPQSLEEPQRPQESFLPILSPMRAVTEYFANHKCATVKIVLAIITFLFILLIIYQFPSVLIKKLLKLD